MKIAIIDCGAGNLHSVRKAFQRVMPEHATLDLVTDAAALREATHIVLPGVGAFADCMSGLNALPGMRNALEETVRHGTTPFFGICVGMQMLFERGHEHTTTEGLGWFKGEVRKIAPTDPNLRIPHMGWNRLRLTHENPVLAGITEQDFVYFVHSYAATGVNPEELLASVDYGGQIVALIGRKNIVASQFHPEKSQRAGLAMIKNFLGMGE
jgi:glutamine amidotransferase